MKTIILVGDGMGDFPLAELGDKTVLEAAHTPAMDCLARRGRIVRLQTVPEGMLPGSDVANLSLLGYRAEEFYTGRSPLEAASLGVELAKNDIAFRLNLVNTQHENAGMTMIDYSAGHISTAEAHELIAALQTILPTSGNADLYPGIDYRHLLVYRGDVASLETVPPHDYPNKDVSHHWQAYQQVPELAGFMVEAQALLADHPVNQQRRKDGKLPATDVWLWGQGKAPAMATMLEQYGISGALISAVDLLKGIGVYAGMEVLEVEGATGYLDTNYQGKVAAALAALEQHDLVFVHVEAPDETGHQGLVDKKMQAVEDFDAKIVGPIAAALENGGDHKIIVCMDHFTPLSMRTHTTDEVPVLFYDSRIPDLETEQRYTEATGRAAKIVFGNGREFMTEVLR